MVPIDGAGMASSQESLEVAMTAWAMASKKGPQAAAPSQILARTPPVFFTRVV